MASVSDGGALGAVGYSCFPQRLFARNQKSMAATYRPFEGPDSLLSFITLQSATVLENKSL